MTTVTPVPQVEITPDVSQYDGLGVRHRYHFANGYEASVVQGPHTYGGSSGLWEVAVCTSSGLCYDTPITDDVIGWCDDAKVAELLMKIAALPTRTK